MEDAKQAIVEIARMDILDGIMLKKDLPCVVGPSGEILSYEVVDRSGGTVKREFVEKPSVVEGFPVAQEDVSSPNPHAYEFKKQLMRNPRLRELVTNVQTGSVFFYRDEATKEKAQQELF